MTLTWRVLLASVLSLFALRAAAETVFVVADPSDPYHRQFLQALQAAPPAGINIDHLQTNAPARAVAASSALVVTVGEAAAKRESNRPGPVLHVFITEAQFESLYPQGVPEDHSAIFLEQSLERYVALVRVALPAVTRLVVPVSRIGSAELSPLRRAAKGAGLVVREQAVGSPEDLDNLLEQSDHLHDAVLFLPVAPLRSNSMMKVAIIGAYKRRLPLVAYSEGLVMAGALTAVHSTVHLLAQEVTEALARFAIQGTLPPPSHPERFTLSVNYQFARVLGVAFPSEAILKHEIEEVLHAR